MSVGEIIMFGENRTIIVREEIKELILLIWNAIKTRQIIAFDFDSIQGNSGERNVKPYMIYIIREKGKEVIKLAGVPRELWHISPEKQKHARHYLLSKIDLGKIKVLPETFTDPGVLRSMVVSTKKSEVICRFIYSDEAPTEVMKSWIKIEGLDLT